MAWGRATLAFLSSRLVHAPSWQDTLTGEQEIKKSLRKALFKCKLHAETINLNRRTATYDSVTDTSQLPVR